MLSLSLYDFACPPPAEKHHMPQRWCQDWLSRDRRPAPLGLSNQCGNVLSKSALTVPFRSTHIRTHFMQCGYDLPALSSPSNLAARTGSAYNSTYAYLTATRLLVTHLHSTVDEVISLSGAGQNCSNTAVLKYALLILRFWKTLRHRQE